MKPCAQPSHTRTDQNRCQTAPTNPNTKPTRYLLVFTGFALRLSGHLVQLIAKTSMLNTSYSVTCSHTTRANLLLCPHLYWSLPPRALRIERPSLCASFSVVVSTRQSPFVACKRIIRSNGFFCRARSSSLRRILAISFRFAASTPTRCSSPPGNRSRVFVQAGQ